MKPANPLLAISEFGLLTWQYDGQARFEKILADSDGKWLQITIKEPKQPKSLEQMGWYFAAILPTATLAAHEKGWTITEAWSGGTYERNYNKDDMDMHLKRMCARMDEDGNLHLACEKDTRPVLFKRAMSKESAQQFLDNVLTYVAQALDCYIPEPIRKKK